MTPPPGADLTLPLIEGIDPDVVARLARFQVVPIPPTTPGHDLPDSMLRPPLVGLRCDRPPHADGHLMVLVLLGGHDYLYDLATDAKPDTQWLDLADLVNHALEHDAEYHPAPS